jgi:DNA-binding MarR family transcriptional regulator
LLEFWPQFSQISEVHKQISPERSDLAMSDEIRELKKRIAELEAENAALKAQSKKELQRVLDPKQQQILKFLFDHPQNMTVAQIAAHCKISKTDADSHLDTLFASGRVAAQQNLSEFRSTGITTGFIITALGRATIMRSAK